MTSYRLYKSIDHSLITNPEHSLQTRVHSTIPNKNTHDLVMPHNVATLPWESRRELQRSPVERGDCSWSLTPAITPVSGLPSSQTPHAPLWEWQWPRTFFFYSRPATSFAWFSSPFKSLRYILWRRYKWKIITFLVIVLIVALVALFFYAAPVSCLL